MKFIYLSLLLFVGFISAVCGQNFSVQGTKILDPTGAEFIIKGTNINGPHWPWQRSPIPDANLIADIWKFNAVRINCLPSAPHLNTNTDLDAIVNAFTAKKVVAIIEVHDFTGEYPNATELTALKNWWVDKANKFKNNPYVWFNIMNEPGGNNDPAGEIWKTSHETVIEAIRAAGANNIIVLDGHQFGQEGGFRDPEKSAILKYGQYFTGKYNNIAFSLHIYYSWLEGQQRLENYIDAVQAKNLALFIGEFGGSEIGIRKATADMFKAIIPKKIGRMNWHWSSDGDPNDLTLGTSLGGGHEINRTDGTKPSNLSWMGELVWRDNYGTLTPNTNEAFYMHEAMLNGGFEKDMEGWIGFGSHQLSTTIKASGAKGLHIRSTGTGGAVQFINLDPNTSYTYSALGRTDAATKGFDTGVKYKLPNNSEVNHSLSFNTTTFAKKEVVFTTPGTFTEPSIFVYKGITDINAYLDEITLVKSSVLSIKEEQNAGSIVVFPNPTSGKFQVSWDKISTTKKATVQVYSLIGNKIAEKVFAQSDLTGNAEINLEHAVPGMYLILVSGDDFYFQRKIQKK